MKQIGWLFLLCTCMWGCQKKEIKQSQIRVVYDQPMIADYCMKVVANEEEFAQFKCNPIYHLIGENLSYEEGLRSIAVIMQQFPSLFAQRELFRENDRIGSPVTYAYADWGMFSPTTLRYVEIAGRVAKELGDLSGKHVVQIGAGYGGLCKILHSLFSCASYTIVDLPEQLMLARRYLLTCGLSDIRFCTLEELPKEAHYDCAISDVSFFEFDKRYQNLLMTRVLKQAEMGLLIGKELPKYYGLSPFKRSELQHRLIKKGINTKLISDEGFYQILWQSGSVSKHSNYIGV